MISQRHLLARLILFYERGGLIVLFHPYIGLYIELDTGDDMRYHVLYIPGENLFSGDLALEGGHLVSSTGNFRF